MNIDFDKAPCVFLSDDGDAISSNKLFLSFR